MASAGSSCMTAPVTAPPAEAGTVAIQRSWRGKDAAAHAHRLFGRGSDGPRACAAASASWTEHAGGTGEGRGRGQRHGRRQPCAVNGATRGLVAHPRTACGRPASHDGLSGGSPAAVRRRRASHRRSAAHSWPASRTALRQAVPPWRRRRCSAAVPTLHARCGCGRTAGAVTGALAVGMHAGRHAGRHAAGCGRPSARSRARPWCRGAVVPSSSSSSSSSSPSPPSPTRRAARRSPSSRGQIAAKTKHRGTRAMRRCGSCSGRRGEGSAASAWLVARRHPCAHHASSTWRPPAACLCPPHARCQSAVRTHLGPSSPLPPRPGRPPRRGRAVATPARVGPRCPLSSPSSTISQTPPHTLASQHVRARREKEPARVGRATLRCSASGRPGPAGDHPRRSNICARSVVGCHGPAHPSAWVPSAERLFGVSTVAATALANDSQRA
jgi:hypothetical protein